LYLSPVLDVLDDLLISGNDLRKQFKDSRQLRGGNDDNTVRGITEDKVSGRDGDTGDSDGDVVRMGLSCEALADCRGSGGPDLWLKRCQ